MNLSAGQLARLADDTGLQTNGLEKVLRLLDLLNSLRAHPYLRERVVLKGGTALNLFLFDLPRLSVDIDLNYIGAIDREVMLDERPKVEQAVRAVCERESYTIRRTPTEHAGGKWRLGYRTVDGRPGNLEVDLNFLARLPLWRPTSIDSIQVGTWQAKQISVLDRHELAAGKLSALFSRTAARDLFDAHEILGRDDLDPERLRMAFVVYAGMARRDMREARIEDVGADTEDVRQRLLPLLRSDLVPHRNGTPRWIEGLVARCRSRLGSVLPLRDRERAFLTALNGSGDITPALLTGDVAMQERIARQPGLLWKAQNVRRHAHRDRE